ncbi:alpha/beta fold hydrolase [Aggregicoccus sp. 17bor-14]|nr:MULTISPECIES: alpha/beta fold hydrolase [Myxococcaceae]MBF5041702.1 alpha/beta fold hydrolase [Simulacricoccus sp. 17bor-14]MRI87484.1 alpha/beta fold hydrolase [Aggregicoccus sp. 17bor-14]
MDLEKTAPFELGAGKDACLLVHGFTGSPWDLRPLGEALAGRGLRVRCPRLPGHGTTPRAMSSVGARDWEAAVEGALAELSERSTGGRVFVGGLSMGALLAVLLAARHPERVGALALVAPALRFRGPTMYALKRLGRYPLLEWLRPWIEKNGTDIESPEVLAEAPILKAFPSARLNDMWALQDAAWAALPRVRCPVLVAVAAQDHVVDPGGGKLLVQRLTQAPSVRFIHIQDGFHIIPRDRGGPLLAEEVGAFFDRVRLEGGER